MPAQLVPRLVVIVAFALTFVVGLGVGVVVGKLTGPVEFVVDNHVNRDDLRRIVNEMAEIASK